MPSLSLKLGKSYVYFIPKTITHVFAVEFIANRLVFQLGEEIQTRKLLDELYGFMFDSKSNLKVKK